MEFGMDGSGYRIEGRTVSFGCFDEGDKGDGTMTVERSLVDLEEAWWLMDEWLAEFKDRGLIEVGLRPVNGKYQVWVKVKDKTE